jgi:hypothetical protein
MAQALELPHKKAPPNKFPLAYSPRCCIFPYVSAKDEILSLIATEKSQMDSLKRRARENLQRMAGFKAAMNALEKSKDEGARNAVSQIIGKMTIAQNQAREIEAQIFDAVSRKNALEEVAAMFQDEEPAPKIKMPIRRTAPPPPTEWDYAHKDLRAGTDIYKVREVLRKHGKPIPLIQIVSEIFGPESVDLKQGKYANLRGTLVGYASQNRIFTIEAKSPHVIGLIEFNNNLPLE